MPTWLWGTTLQASSILECPTHWLKKHVLLLLNNFLPFWGCPINWRHYWRSYGIVLSFWSNSHGKIPKENLQTNMTFRYTMNHWDDIYIYMYVRYLYIYIHTLYTFVLFLDRPPVQAGPDSRPAQGCSAQCALGTKCWVDHQYRWWNVVWIHEDIDNW